MGDKLLTQKDLAERWQVSVQGFPAIRFHPEYIAKLEGTKLEKFSPLYVKKLEQELENTKKENEELRGILSKILVESSRVIELLKKKKEV